MVTKQPKLDSFVLTGGQEQVLAVLNVNIFDHITVSCSNKILLRYAIVEKQLSLWPGQTRVDSDAIWYYTRLRNLKLVREFSMKFSACYKRCFGRSVQVCDISKMSQVPSISMKFCNHVWL